MKARCTLAALLLLPTVTGCATNSVKGMQERQPLLTATSQRSVQQISECVSAAWVAEGVTPRSIARANGVSLVAELTMVRTVITSVLDLDVRDGATAVVLRGIKTIRPALNRRRLKDVRSCL